MGWALGLSWLALGLCCGALLALILTLSAEVHRLQHWIERLERLERRQLSAADEQAARANAENASPRRSADAPADFGDAGSR